MKVIDPGHIYLLDRLDSSEKTNLVFVKRQGEKYPGNENAYPGTNMQEVIRALIDRCKYVYKQIPCEETAMVIVHLRRALLDLEMRAAKRHGRAAPSTYTHGIEERPYCSECGHIGCTGECQ